MAPGADRHPEVSTQPVAVTLGPGRQCPRPSARTQDQGVVPFLVAGHALGD